MRLIGVAGRRPRANTYHRHLHQTQLCGTPKTPHTTTSGAGAAPHAVPLARLKDAALFDDHYCLLTTCVCALPLQTFLRPSAKGRCSRVRADYVRSKYARAYSLYYAFANKHVNQCDALRRSYHAMLLMRHSPPIYNVCCETVPSAIWPCSCTHCLVSANSNNRHNSD